MDQEELNSKLLEAAEKGDTDKIWELIEQGADINARDEYGMTALMKSAYNGHLTPELLDAFMKNSEAHPSPQGGRRDGAYINVRNNGGWTALIYSAVRKGHLTPELLDFFMTYGADINAQNEAGNTALMFLAINGHLTPELLGTFISNGADINARNQWGNTALIVSASRGHLTPELLEAFASNGAQINVRNNDGETALIWSARRGHLTQELARAFAEQFIRLGTPLEEIQKQLPASKEAPAILVSVLIDKLESKPGLVVDFMKKHVGKKLQEWVDNGVEGAATLVSRLVPYMEKQAGKVGGMGIEFF